MKRQNLRTVSLIVVTFTYLLIGAAIFGYLESEHEVRQRETLELIELIVKRKYNISDDDFTVLTTTVIKSVPHKAGIQWKFPGAFYFATTVVTTIGYGHSTPATMAGRSFCMIYALIGIPLGLVMFQSIGERLNTFVGSALKYAKRCFKAKNPEVTQTNLVMVVSVLSTILMTSMAAVFAKYERWDYFDALYYCFITLTTIGFGDYVALQKESALQSKPEYVALSLIFILFGLSVVSSAVNLLVLKFLTLNTEDERRDEQLRYTANLNPIQLEGDVITSSGPAIGSSSALLASKRIQAADKSPAAHSASTGSSATGNSRQLALTSSIGRQQQQQNQSDELAILPANRTSRPSSMLNGRLQSGKSSKVRSYSQEFSGSHSSEMTTELDDEKEDDDDDEDDDEEEEEDDAEEEVGDRDDDDDEEEEEDFDGLNRHFLNHRLHDCSQILGDKLNHQHLTSLPISSYKISHPMHLRASKIRCLNNSKPQRTTINDNCVQLPVQRHHDHHLPHHYHKQQQPPLRMMGLTNPKRAALSQTKLSPCRRKMSQGFQRRPLLAHHEHQLEAYEARDDSQSLHLVRSPKRTSDVAVDLSYQQQGDIGEYPERHLHGHHSHHHHNHRRQQQNRSQRGHHSHHQDPVQIPTVDAHLGGQQCIGAQLKIGEQEFNCRCSWPSVDSANSNNNMEQYGLPPILCPRCPTFETTISCPYIISQKQSKRHRSEIKRHHYCHTETGTSIHKSQISNSRIKGQKQSDLEPSLYIVGRGEMSPKAIGQPPVIQHPVYQASSSARVLTLTRNRPPTRAISSSSLMVTSDKLAGTNEEAPSILTRSQAELAPSERRKQPIARLVCKCCCQHLECIEHALESRSQPQEVDRAGEIETSSGIDALQLLDKTNKWSQTDALDTGTIVASEQQCIGAEITSTICTTRTKESDKEEQ